VFDLSDIFDILCYIFAHNGDEPFKDYDALIYNVYKTRFNYSPVLIQMKAWMFRSCDVRRLGCGLRDELIIE